MASTLQALAIPGVLCLICFLSFSSQYLFRSLPPRPLSRDEVILFNITILFLLISYVRSVWTNPGRVQNRKSKDEDVANGSGERHHLPNKRWCRKCEQIKPPRAHHCKVCQRYIYQILNDSGPLTYASVDASQKWITTVRGRGIAYPIGPFRIL
jgi:palmitoyltransferase